MPNKEEKNRQNLEAMHSFLNVVTEPKQSSLCLRILHNAMVSICDRIDREYLDWRLLIIMVMDLIHCFCLVLNEVVCVVFVTVTYFHAIGSEKIG